MRSSVLNAIDRCIGPHHARVYTHQSLTVVSIECNPLSPDVMACDGLAGLGLALSHLHPWHPSCKRCTGLGPLLFPFACRLEAGIADMKVFGLLLLCTAVHLAAVHGATRAHKALVTPLSLTAAQVPNTY